MKLETLFGIDGKVALVTGGSRGIGEMIAAGFLANGVKVYISSRKSAVCDETARRLDPARVINIGSIAGIAIFLSSRAGAYTVGEVIRCDGGVATA